MSAASTVHRAPVDPVDPVDPATPDTPAGSGGSAGPAVPRRRDASMSLLQETVEKALEPGYASAAARRRSTSPDGAARRPRSRTATGGVVALAVALGLVACVAVVSLRAPAPPEERDSLMDEIASRQEAADDAAARVEALRADVDVRSDAALAGSAAALVSATQTAGLLAATTAVHGPGLRLSLDDAPGSRDGAAGGDPRDATADDQGRVLDRDLQVVVNGHRLTSLSSIRVAGQAILVDYQPLTPPYVVEAIGEPRAMADAFAASTAGAYVGALEDAYDVQVVSTAHRRLDLPAGSVETLREARVPAAADPAATEGVQR